MTHCNPLSLPLKLSLILPLGQGSSWALWPASVISSPWLTGSYPCSALSSFLTSPCGGKGSSSSFTESCTQATSPVSGTLCGEATRKDPSWDLEPVSASMAERVEPVHQHVHSE